MKQIYDNLTFSDLKKDLDNAFFLNREFPEQIFKRAQHFIFLEFDAFCLEKFYNAFIRIAGPSLFFTLEPDPEKYYYHFFEKYNVFTFSQEDSFRDYIDLLHKQPERGGADAIVDIVEKMVIFSLRSDIAVYGSRDIGCLVVGFATQESMGSFEDEYGIEHIFSLQEAMDDIIPLSFENADLIKNNYGL